MNKWGHYLNLTCLEVRAHNRFGENTFSSKLHFDLDTVSIIEKIHTDFSNKQKIILKRTKLFTL